MNELTQGFNKKNSCPEDSLTISTPER
jgi:hypothetical protein